MRYDRERKYTEGVVITMITGKIHQFFASEYQYHSGNSEELDSFLQSKLSPMDYLTAEEMLHSLLAEEEEKAFTAGLQCLPKLFQKILDFE